MKILICGDRYWWNEKPIQELIDTFSDDTVVINGGAKGADTIAAKCAKKHGLKTITVMAEWEKYGRAAGPIRNAKMLEYKPDKVFAFHDNLESSKGTKNMIRLAQKANIQVEVISNN